MEAYRHSCLLQQTSHLPAAMTQDATVSTAAAMQTAHLLTLATTLLRCLMLQLAVHESRMLFWQIWSLPCCKRQAAFCWLSKLQSNAASPKTFAAADAGTAALKPQPLAYLH